MRGARCHRSCQIRPASRTVSEDLEEGCAAGDPAGDQIGPVLGAAAVGHRHAVDEQLRGRGGDVGQSETPWTIIPRRTTVPLPSSASESAAPTARRQGFRPPVAATAPGAERPRQQGPPYPKRIAVGEVTQFVGQERSPGRSWQHHPQGDPDDEHRPLAPTQPGDTRVEAQVRTDHVGNRCTRGIGHLPYQTVQVRSLALGDHAIRGHPPERRLDQQQDERSGDRQSQPDARRQVAGHGEPDEVAHRRQPQQGQHHGDCRQPGLARRCCSRACRRVGQQLLMRRPVDLQPAPEPPTADHPWCRAREPGRGRTRPGSTGRRDTTEAPLRPSAPGRGHSPDTCLASSSSSARGWSVDRSDRNARSGSGPRGDTAAVADVNGRNTWDRPPKASRAHLSAAQSDVAINWVHGGWGTLRLQHDLSSRVAGLTQLVGRGRLLQGEHGSDRHREAALLGEVAGGGDSSERR